MSGYTIVVIMVLVMLASLAVFLLQADESELTATSPDEEPRPPLPLDHDDNAVVPVEEPGDVDAGNLPDRRERIETGSVPSQGTSREHAAE